MKLSTRQAGLLATRVREKLQANSTAVVDPLKRKEIQKWITERDKLRKVQDAAEKAIKEHYNTFYKITGLDKYHGTNDEKLIAVEMSKKAVPSLQAIEDEIILSSMFAEDQDLEGFIEGIVKKFASKKATK